MSGTRVATTFAPSFQVDVVGGCHIHLEGRSEYGSRSVFALGLREGLEAAVVVAVVAVVVRPTRFRRRLLVSIGGALAVCVVVVLLVRSVNATASDQTRQLVKLFVAGGAVVALTSTARWMLRYGRDGVAPAGTLLLSPAQATALIATASLAVVREGLELAVLPAASSHDPWAPSSPSMLAGVGVATGIGLLAYAVGSRSLGVTVRVSAPLLLLIAGGLTTAVVRSAHAAFRVDAAAAFEISWLAELPAWLRDLTRGLFGWHASPTATEALVYVVYGVGAALLLLRCWPRPATPAGPRWAGPGWDDQRLDGPHGDERRREARER